MKNATLTSLKRQGGYTLLEMAFVLILMGWALLMVIVTQIDQARYDRMRAVAETYQRINSAVGSYMGVYYNNLITLKPECSIPTWAANYPADLGATPVARNDCVLSLALNGRPNVTVANGLQPTLDELSALRLLDRASIANGLPLPTLTASKTNLDSIPIGNWWVGGQSGALPPQFMVLIQFICLNGSGLFTQTGACVDPATSKDGAFDLRSLVFNSQPYDLDRSGGTLLLSKMLQAAGGNAFLSSRLSGDASDGGSSNTNNGELWAVNGMAEAMLPNPVRHLPTNLGAPNIFAMRNGLGSAGWDLYVRRDGSTPMTGTWNTNLTLGTQDPLTGTGSSQFTVNGDSTFNGQGNFTKELYAKKGFFGAPGLLPSGPVSSNYDLLAVQAYFGTLFTHTLLVGQQSVFYNLMNITGGLRTIPTSTATFDGPVTLNNTTSAYQFKLALEANLGDNCDFNTTTMTRAAATSAKYPSPDNLRLLVCDRETSTWVPAGPNHQPQIDALNSQVSGLSSQVSGLVTQVANLLKNAKPDTNAVEVTIPYSAVPQPTGYSCSTYYRPMFSSMSTSNPLGFNLDASCGNDNNWTVSLTLPTSVAASNPGTATFLLLKRNVGYVVDEAVFSAQSMTSGYNSTNGACSNYYRPVMSSAQNIQLLPFYFDAMCATDGLWYVSLNVSNWVSGSAVTSLIQRTTNVMVQEVSAVSSSSSHSTGYSCTDYYRPVFSSSSGAGYGGFTVKTQCDGSNMWNVNFVSGTGTGTALFQLIKKL